MPFGAANDAAAVRTITAAARCFGGVYKDCCRLFLVLRASIIGLFTASAAFETAVVAADASLLCSPPFDRKQRCPRHNARLSGYVFVGLLSVGLSQQTCPTSAPTPPEPHLIVRFHQYQHWPANHALLGSVLGQPAGPKETFAAPYDGNGAGGLPSGLGGAKPNRLWQPLFGHRHPKALQLPTDFAVVRLAYEGKAHAALISAIANLPGVKSVSPDTTVRSLLADKLGSSSSRDSRASRTTNNDTSAAGWLPSKKPWRRRLRRAFQRSWAFQEEEGDEDGDEDEDDDKSASRTTVGDRRAVLNDGGYRRKLAAQTAASGDSEGYEGGGDDDDDSNSDLAQASHRSSDAAAAAAAPLGSGRGVRRSGKSSGGLSGTATAVQGAALHARGLRGQGVKVAVFDTGLHAAHPHFTNVVERINWTNDRQLSDGIGHGTFVAGVVCSSHPDCPGWAPDADLHTFRVFTNKQVSYTSWFLDAFNYAMARGIDVLNLSIGGPDHADRPFVEKVWEMTASGIIVVSAIGNDGPLYGTLNNPADQYDTIGVGGVTDRGGMAKFSSRGMSTWELPMGYGRFKPDLVALGSSVRGSKVLSKSGEAGCRALSGTSVASPVVAGAVALLLSHPPSRNHGGAAGSSAVATASADRLLSTDSSAARQRLRELRASPAAVKQVLVESATKHAISGVFEQGAGALNVTYAYALLEAYQPRATFLPSQLDWSSGDGSASSSSSCAQDPYMWPYCSQPLYYTGSPAIANLTVINGLGVSGEISNVAWMQDEPSLLQSNGQEEPLVEVSVEHQPVVWPWSGWFAVKVSVSKHAAARGFQGTVKGRITCVVSGVDAQGVKREQALELPLAVQVVPTPRREQRLLWDQFHSISYPSGYFPRDNLKVQGDMLDWTGDHPHTNFRDAYHALRAQGYFIEVLSSDFTCFDASLYGAVLVVDPEEEFFAAEIAKIEFDVRQLGLGLIVVADWYSQPTIDQAAFFDDNTRSDWVAVTGGANVPAINDLLKPFGIGFSDRVFDGAWSIGPGAQSQVSFLSGVGISTWPATGYLRATRSGELKERDVKGLRGGRASSSSSQGKDSKKQDAAEKGAAAAAAAARYSRAPPHVLGALDTCSTPKGCDTITSSAATSSAVNKNMRQHGGKVVVYGDSSCLDSWAKGSPLCTDLLIAMVEYASSGERRKAFFRDQDIQVRAFEEDSLRPVPQRMPNNELYKYSRVIAGPGQPTKGAGDSCAWATRMRRV